LCLFVLYVELHSARSTKQPSFILENLFNCGSPYRELSQCSRYVIVASLLQIYSIFTECLPPQAHLTTNVGLLHPFFPKFAMEVGLASALALPQLDSSNLSGPPPLLHEILGEVVLLIDMAYDRVDIHEQIKLYQDGSVSGHKLFLLGQVCLQYLAVSIVPLESLHFVIPRIPSCDYSSDLL
jgi:hypothetical protein